MAEREKPDFLREAEAAELLRVSQRTLQRHRERGTGPAYTRLGTGLRGRLAYERRAIESWLQSQAVTA